MGREGGMAGLTLGGAIVIAGIVIAIFWNVLVGSSSRSSDCWRSAGSHEGAGTRLVLGRRLVDLERHAPPATAPAQGCRGRSV